MPGLSGKELDECGELRYRRGFAHGARATIDSVIPFLSPDQAATLRIWVTTGLVEWQSFRGGRFQPPPAPDLG